jgi:hypothetical protein
LALLEYQAVGYGQPEPGAAGLSHSEIEAARLIPQLAWAVIYLHCTGWREGLITEIRSPMA